jgi:hypothetical protein
MLLAGCTSERGALSAGSMPTARMQKADLDSAVAEPPPKVEGHVASRVRATVNGRPILDDELREACWLPLREIANLPQPQLGLRQKEILQQKLNELIDREVLYGEAEDRLLKREQVWKKLMEFGDKEFDKTIRSMQHRSGAKNEDELREVLAAQGMTMFNLKRQIVRGFVANEFARSRIFPRIDQLGHNELRRYYDEHPGEFQNEDRVKWEDIFIDADSPAFKGRSEARQLAEQVAEQARLGASMAVLSEQYNMGESKYRKAEGMGGKRGEIKPIEVEPYLFQMQEGQVMIVELPTGYHIIRLAQRDFAGPQPFDERTQNEIRKKLTSIIADREYKRLIKELRSKATIQVMLDD